MKASAIPWRLYCGTSQNTKMGIVDLGLSIRPLAKAACFRFTSMNPATRVASIEMKKPMAIRCKKFIPRSSPVNLRATRTNRRSYKTIVMSMEDMAKTDMEAEGISKDFVSCLSIVLACCSENVFCCAEDVAKRIPAAQIGNILIIDFNSSTL